MGHPDRRRELVRHQWKSCTDSPQADSGAATRTGNKPSTPTTGARAEGDRLRAVAERTDLDTEFRIIRPDGETRWIASKGKVFYRDDGEPLRMLGVSMDITERKRIEEALRDADRKKDEFLATLAHELRNPLAPIRNALGILQTTGPAQPELEWGRGVLDRQVRADGAAARGPARRVPHFPQQAGTPQGAGRTSRRAGGRPGNEPSGH